MVSIQRDTYKIRRNFRLIHRLPDLARIISWTRWNTYRGIGRPITRIPSPPTWPLPQIQIYTHVHSILWNEYEYVISRILVVHGWNERRRRGVGRGRNEEGNETPVFQRCCIHEAEWTDGRCTLEHELSLSPSVNARLHGTWTCPLAIYTECASCHVGVWTSIHARSGRIKASHVQFHGTKIFFRGISILLPLHAWNLCLVPSWTWLSDFHAFPCRRVLICNTMHGEARARHTRIDIGYLVWLVTTAARDEWQWGETMILTRKM